MLAQKLTTCVNFSASLKVDNLYKWYADFLGPHGSVYEVGFFIIEMHFPPEYPFKPSKVKTRIW